MGEMPDSFRPIAADDPRLAVKRRASGGGCASSRAVGDADYGYGCAQLPLCRAPIVGHRGGVSGYRSLILFDPQRKMVSWRCGTAIRTSRRPLEFEVMDMLYHLPFRDWMELVAARREWRRLTTPMPRAAPQLHRQDGSPARLSHPLVYRAALGTCTLRGEFPKRYREPKCQN